MRAGCPLLLSAYDRPVPHCQHWSNCPSITSPHFLHFHVAALGWSDRSDWERMFRASSALASSNTQSSMIAMLSLVAMGTRQVNQAARLGRP